MIKTSVVIATILNRATLFISKLASNLVDFLNLVFIKLEVSLTINHMAATLFSLDSNLNNDIAQMWEIERFSIMWIEMCHG